MRTLFLFVFFVFTAITWSYAHGGKKHKKDSVKQDTTVVKTDSTTHNHSDEGHSFEKPLSADLDDFPSVHPLIVHFAIVLIVIAAVLQVVNLIFLKKDFAWVVTGLIVIGFTTAVLASTKFHPHTHDLSEHAKAVLSLHDQYARWTLYVTGLAGALQIINLFLFKRKRWAFGVVAIAMLSATYCIIHAGHYGAQLVHIEGVGPQGKFLEIEHHH